MENNIKNQDLGLEIYNTLIEKSWQDDTFKSQLIENPANAIESITGRSFGLPNNKKLVVEDQSNESFIYLNIPQKRELDELELTDEQLEAVSGGELATLGAIATYAAIAYVVYDIGVGIRDGWNDASKGKH